MLLDIDGEELEINISVASVETMASKIHIKSDTQGQPKSSVTFRKGHETIFEYLMIKTKADLRNCLSKVHFHMDQLIGIRQDPRYAAEPYVVGFATNNDDAHVAGAIRPLFKSNLPRGLAAPIS